MNNKPYDMEAIKFDNVKDMVKYQHKLYSDDIKSFYERLKQTHDFMNSKPVDDMNDEELMKMAAVMEMVNAICACDKILSLYQSKRTDDINKEIRLDKSVYEYFMDIIIVMNNSYDEEMDKIRD